MLLKKKGEPVDTLRDGNRLIDSLPPRQRNGVLAQCEHVELAFGTVLCEVGKPFSYAYFPIAGSISLVKTLFGHEPLETESIGSEGMLGATLVLNMNLAPQRGVVQTPCLALRMKAKEYPSSIARVLRRHPADATARTLKIMRASSLDP